MHGWARDTARPRPRARNWRYPDVREGKVQRQDPDDDTADGSDAIAALRYLVMSWWKGAKYEKPVEKAPRRNFDSAFSKTMTAIERRARRQTRYPF